MNKFKLSFHHLGLAVSSSEKAVSFLRGLGYEIGNEIDDEAQRVKLILCKHNVMPDVEVIYSVLNSNPIDKIIKRCGENIYHICYYTNNLQESLNLIKEEGHRIICINDVKPAILFDGKNVSFYYIKGFGLIEILEL